MEKKLFNILAVAVIVNIIITAVLAVWLLIGLQSIQRDVCEIKVLLDEEIKLREELFPQLKKSADLLGYYNPSLSYKTALKYAVKIFQCSDDEVSPDLLTALIVVESSADHRAESIKGALGLTQVMPNIWQYEPDVLLDPFQNIEIGARILKYYIERFGLVGGLSAYNSGKQDRALGYAHKVLRVAQLNF